MSLNGCRWLSRWYGGSITIFIFVNLYLIYDSVSPSFFYYSYHFFLTVLNVTQCHNFNFVTSYIFYVTKTSDKNINWVAGFVSLIHFYSWFPGTGTGRVASLGLMVEMSDMEVCLDHYWSSLSWILYVVTHCSHNNVSFHSSTNIQYTAVLTLSIPYNTIPIWWFLFLFWKRLKSKK